MTTTHTDAAYDWYNDSKLDPRPISGATPQNAA